MTYDLLHISSPKGPARFLNAVDPTKQALLDLLIDNEFKDCVAHPSVQSYVSEIWSGKINLYHQEGRIIQNFEKLDFILKKH